MNPEVKILPEKEVPTELRHKIDESVARAQTWADQQAEEAEYDAAMEAYRQDELAQERAAKGKDKEAEKLEWYRGRQEAEDARRYELERQRLRNESTRAKLGGVSKVLGAFSSKSTLVKIGTLGGPILKNGKIAHEDLYSSKGMRPLTTFPGNSSALRRPISVSPDLYAPIKVRPMDLSKLKNAQTITSPLSQLAQRSKPGLFNQGVKVRVAPALDRQLIIKGAEAIEPAGIPVWFYNLPLKAWEVSNSASIATMKNGTYRFYATSDRTGRLLSKTIGKNLDNADRVASKHSKK